MQERAARERTQDRSRHGERRDPHEPHHHAQGAAPTPGCLPPNPAPEELASAVIDRNVLGERSENTRARSLRYLRELYVLDPRSVLFRGLRDLWDLDEAAQPLLALTCALARDPLLRATADAVLEAPPGTSVASTMLADGVADRYAGTYSDPVRSQVGRNAASSWTQSGHLVGRSPKVRSRAVCRPAAVAYALLLGHLEDARGLGAPANRVGSSPRRPVEFPDPRCVASTSAGDRSVVLGSRYWTTAAQSPARASPI